METERAYTWADPQGEAETTGGIVCCSDCGTIGYRGDTYCACCGKALVRICPSCRGRVMQAVANYCTRCGGPLPRTATP